MACSDAQVTCIGRSSSSVVRSEACDSCGSGRFFSGESERINANTKNRSMTEEEVLWRVRERGDQLIIACGQVFDVARLGDVHPGGKQVLIESVGLDVTKLFFGANASDTNTTRRRSHVHSHAAFKSLMHYRVGRLRHGDDSATADATGSSRWMAPLPVGTNNKTSYDAWSKVVAGGYDVCSSDAPSTSDVRVSACVDMDKPIVEQIGRLQADTYVEWIRCPNMDTGSVRFFESDILEACSKAYWFMVPLIWIPVAVIAIVSAIYEASPWTFYTHEIDAHIGVAILCTVGYLLWFVLEYCIHRFIFHLSPVTTWGKTMHFIAHGCHHKFPMDRMRLVFPPAAAVPFALGLKVILSALLPNAAAKPLFGGAVLGYVVYDVTHYAVHSGLAEGWEARLPWLTQLRAAHFYHHFVNETHNYGITSSTLDKVFFSERLPATL